MFKQCHVCSVIKPIDDFYCLSKARATQGDGHDTTCKDCVKSRMKIPEVKQRANELRRTRGKTEKRKEANRQWAKTEKGKKCQRAKNKRHYWKNKDKLLAEQRIYRQTEAYKKAVQESREKYPEKRKAQIVVMNAIASGHLIRPGSCSICSEFCKPDAHHIDYSKPLEVIWVCRKCHAAYRCLT